MSSVELTELVYSDLYFDKKCDVERCIQLIDLYFNGPDTELLEKQVRHRESLRCRVIPHTTTAWNFLNVVRPDDVDGVGLEFAGKRVWDLFWTAAERVAGSSEHAIEMPEGAVTTSADGYMLAIVFTREDGDQREEPELYVWDLRPMVRQLAWESRRNFLHFLYGHKFQRLLCGSIGITNADASNVNITTVFSSISLTAESAGFDHPGPSACCQVFYNAALIKIITLYLI